MDQMIDVLKNIVLACETNGLLNLPFVRDARALIDNPSSQGHALPVPPLWAARGYCKEAGEEECLHPTDELRWNGEHWCCADYSGDDDRDLWETSPRLPPPFLTPSVAT